MNSSPYSQIGSAAGGAASTAIMAIAAANGWNPGGWAIAGIAALASIFGGGVGGLLGKSGRGDPFLRGDMFLDFTNPEAYLADNYDWKDLYGYDRGKSSKYSILDQGNYTIASIGHRTGGWDSSDASDAQVELMAAVADSAMTQVQSFLDVLPDALSSGFTDYLSGNPLHISSTIKDMSDGRGEFSLVRGIILNTPFLLAQIGRDNVQRYKIEYPALQNSIRTVSTNISGLYGEKITIGWVSELHAAQSEEPAQVLASSLGDTVDSWLLVDSTVDAIGGPLHRMEQLAETGKDPTIFVRRIEYRDLEEALEKSPPWIRRDWLKSRKAQLLPATFATQHLNQRSAAQNNLFALPDIQACMERLPGKTMVEEGLITLQNLGIQKIIDEVSAVTPDVKADIEAREEDRKNIVERNLLLR